MLMEERLVFGKCILAEPLREHKNIRNSWWTFCADMIANQYLTLPVAQGISFFIMCYEKIFKK